MDRMLEIPADRKPLKPALLCALMAVTAMLVMALELRPLHGAGPGVEASAQAPGL